MRIGAILAAGCLMGLQDSPSDALRRGWTGVRGLIEQGEAVRPTLTALAEDRDPDVSFYARAALAELDGLGCPGASVPVRTKAIRGVSSVDALRELFKAAGMKFSGDLPDRALTIPDGLPLLEALEEASRALDVEFYLAAGGWKVTPGYLHAPRFAFGRFRIRFDQIQREARNSFERPISGSCRLRARLSGDGAARLVSVSDVRVLEAKDDRGVDLVRKPGLGTYQFLPEGHTLFVELSPPAPTARVVARLRLVVTASLEKKRDAIWLDLRNPEGTAAGRKIRLKAIERDAEGWRVDLDAVPAPEAADGFALVNEKGTAFELIRTRSTALIFRADEKAGRPVRFGMRAVTETFSRRVFLELKDLPLP